MRSDARKRLADQPKPKPNRIKVACINWSHDDAPHALTYALIDDVMFYERFFETWTEAVAHARDLARLLPAGGVA